jgi:hypothetical protein
MPKATIDNNEVTFELKSLPTGFVKLKRMTYGDWLARRDMSMQMSFAIPTKGSNTPESSFELQNKKVTLFELSRCVVDHNLEDENEKKLDFTRADILDFLDPRVGNEIGELIASMHDFEESLKN